MKKILGIFTIVAFVLICGNILWSMWLGEVLEAILYLGFVLLFILSHCLIELSEIAWQLREKERKQ
ncbi:hypothetical protein [Ligilactobacillus animalis]|uniref:hypothetical protein n=1 Tax=Ligilactobacillus animalis TaxID=1605 RepID=UPI0026E0CFA7|nr:hypothetical protein [Ligilactobacillus animalis]MDO5882552.1 hypothetical protein [Ligilactobacillus animalis]